MQPLLEACDLDSWLFTDSSPGVRWSCKPVGREGAHASVRVWLHSCNIHTALNYRRREDVNGLPQSAFPTAIALNLVAIVYRSIAMVPTSRCILIAAHQPHRTRTSRINESWPAPWALHPSLPACSGCAASGPLRRRPRSSPSPSSSCSQPRSSSPCLP